MKGVIPIRRLIAKPSGELCYYIFFGKVVNYEAMLMAETNVTGQYPLLADFAFSPLFVLLKNSREDFIGAGWRYLEIL